MPKPPNFNDDLLRRVLSRWAVKFTANEKVQNHLVEKTITQVLQDFPEASDDQTIDIELLASMRRIVFEEYGVRSGPAPEKNTDGPSPPDDQ
ncbi:hypothetical protein C241_02784 [Bradyrhizobium lupini HPC(L)]|uniref:Uncharacterized protein n=1 Tax=Bradyrhizobium lupini HPC(L) TaxID=1229491 RepID=A0ABP2RW24_RHILU|nr:hypothetical protein C241_02784 [Bradyrhizobium lupini HPC(L)]